MPRGKPAGFPSPAKVAKTLVSQERQADKDLIAKFSPELMQWDVGADYKILHGENPKQEERLAQLLCAAGWSARIVGTGVEVDYPSSDEEKKTRKSRKKGAGPAGEASK